MSEKLPILVCPHCGNQTPHKRVFSHSCPTTAYNSEGDRYEGAAPDTVYEIYECTTCHDISIYSGIEGEDDSLAFPPGGVVDKSVPEVVAAIFIEAKRVQTISPNAFAVLIRRALEAICDEREVPAGNLHSRLEHLSKRGDIPPVLAEMTTVLRTLGNSGAHNTRHKVSVPTTWQMEKFFVTLIEYVYVAPARLADFRRELEKVTGEEKEHQSAAPRKAVSGPCSGDSSASDTRPSLGPRG